VAAGGFIGAGHAFVRPVATAQAGSGQTDKQSVRQSVGEWERQQSAKVCVASAAGDTGGGFGFGVNAGSAQLQRIGLHALQTRSRSM